MIGLALLFTCVATAATLMLYAFQDNVMYFFTPTQAKEREFKPNENLRLGGYVEENSLIRDGLKAIFTVTDGDNKVTVSYNGILPNLFREGQGVIAEGSFNAQGVFKAETILAKHDENYVPPELAKNLKNPPAGYEK